MGIKSLDELREIREQNKNRTSLRHGENYKGEQIEILVGMATCGIASGARETLNAITQELHRLDLDGVRVIPVGCIGYCNLEPLITVHIPGEQPVAYGHVKANRVEEIINSHIVNKKPVESMVVDIAFDHA